MPPAGVGFFTATLAVPSVRICAAEICAVTCVPFTTAVGCARAFHWTADDEIKFVRFTVRAKAEPPAVSFAGEVFETVGTGLVAALMSKVVLGDLPPPGAGFVTVSSAVPVASMSVAAKAAVMVLLTTVVVRALPFQFTAVFALKFVPLAVSVIAGPPAVAVVGEVKLSLGTGFGWIALHPPLPPLQAVRSKTLNSTNTLLRDLGNGPIFPRLQLSRTHVR